MREFPVARLSVGFVFIFFYFLISAAVRGVCGTRSLSVHHDRDRVRGAVS